MRHRGYHVRRLSKRRDVHANIGYSGTCCRNAQTQVDGRFQRELRFALMQTNGLSWSTAAGSAGSWDEAVIRTLGFEQQLLAKAVLLAALGGRRGTDPPLRARCSA